MNPQPAKPDDKSAQQRGLACPHCGCEHFRVIYTRRALGKKVVRSRECRNCGKRVITYERVAF